MITILIIEDEASVRMLTRAKLKDEYHIIEAENGVDALEMLAHNHVSLIIADIMLPEMAGYECVQTLRENGDITPVIMLTAMNTFAHKKKGFAIGIDDYMTKPIDYEELKWRIEAILRRAKIANDKRIVIGDFMLSSDSHTATYQDTQIELTTKEFELMYKLLSYPDVIFTKQQIMDEIWGYDTETTYDTIKTYISRLRNKFAMCNEFEIVSVRGLGYKVVLRGEV